MRLIKRVFTLTTHSSFASLEDRLFRIPLIASHRNAEGKVKDGYVQADLVKRDDPRDEKHPGGHVRWLFPTRWDVPIAECYHMKVTRHKSKLRWEVNGETMGEAELADDELCLMERLVLYNCGKGTGAIFRNLVIRSRIVDVDPSWPAADRKETQD